MSCPSLFPCERCGKSFVLTQLRLLPLKQNLGWVRSSVTHCSFEPFDGMHVHSYSRRRVDMYSLTIMRVHHLGPCLRCGGWGGTRANKDVGTPVRAASGSLQRRVSQGKDATRLCSSLVSENVVRLYDPYPRIICFAHAGSQNYSLVRAVKSMSMSAPGPSPLTLPCLLCWAFSSAIYHRIAFPELCHHQ